MPICSKCCQSLDAELFDLKSSGQPKSCCRPCPDKKRAAGLASAWDKLVDELEEMPDLDSVLIEIDNAFQDELPINLKFQSACLCADLVADGNPPADNPGNTLDTPESKQAYENLVQDYYHSVEIMVYQYDILFG